MNMTTTTATPDDALSQMGPLRAFWEFTRPHTIIGTSLAVVVFYLLASHAAGHHDFVLLALTYVASLGVNIYITGLNQITDVEIDRINKPYLPLAAGAFSRATGITIVGVAGLIAFIGAALVGRWMLGTVAIVFALGSVYSLPPLRLKRSAFWAASAITLARAVVGNCGVYLSYSENLSGTAHIPPHVFAFVGFMFLFVVVIAIMKDVPDIEGDRRHQISTFVVTLGAEKTLLLCRAILTVAYVCMIAAALIGVSGLHPLATAVTHGLALVVVWAAARGLDTGDKDAVYKYYMVIWKLFYFEFAAFPIASLMA
jgi:homogentisate phytyltransferase/homogentisate geranylgeranyltransferase